MNIIDWILYIPLVFCVCYLLLYAIASKFYRAPQYPEARTLRRIVVLFPAYKEDRVIVASIQSFLEQDYPKTGGIGDFGYCNFGNSSFPCSSSGVLLYSGRDVYRFSSPAYSKSEIYFVG